MTFVEKTINFTSRFRTRVSRVVCSILMMLILFSDNLWSKDNIIDFAFEFVGFILIVICTLGRIWASIYISGYKGKKFIWAGPYSIVRHPLYFFSFLGALGIGASSKSLLILAIIFISFLIYYPFVLLAEEAELTKTLGEEYLKYIQNTPRFFPRVSLLVEPESYTINAQIFRKSLFDVMWFLWFFIILQLIDKLHDIGILPVLLQIP